MYKWSIIYTIMICTNHQFGERIRQERQRLGFSQAQVAQAAGLSKATQVGYEGGARAPDLRYLCYLGDLGFDTYFILTGTHEAEHIRSSIDWDLIQQIVAAVSSWCEAREVEIPTVKLVGLIHVFYDQFCKAGTVDTKALTNMLRLVS